MQASSVEGFELLFKTIDSLIDTADFNFTISQAQI